jgi:hypothetical protein
MHFLPYFQGWDIALPAALPTENPDAEEPDGEEWDPDPVPRYIALHSWPGRTDAIRRFEQEADAVRPDWPKEVFQLKRIDWPLTELVARLADHLARPGRAPGVAL